MPVTWSDSYDGSTCFKFCCLGLHSWVGSYVIPNFINILFFMRIQSFESIETLLSR